MGRDTCVNKIQLELYQVCTYIQPQVSKDGLSRSQYIRISRSVHYSNVYESKSECIKSFYASNPRACQTRTSYASNRSCQIKPRVKPLRVKPDIRQLLIRVKSELVFTPVSSMKIIRETRKNTVMPSQDNYIELGWTKLLYTIYDHWHI